MANAPASGRHGEREIRDILFTVPGTQLPAPFVRARQSTIAAVSTAAMGALYAWIILLTSTCQLGDPLDLHVRAGLAHPSATAFAIISTCPYAE
jgi:hypothetical protein